MSLEWFLRGKKMIRKSSFIKLFLIFILAASLNVYSQTFPTNFFIDYEIKQLDQEGGILKVVFIQDKNLYSLTANSETIGILKLFGDRQITSDGLISKNGFKPFYFSHKNKKKPEKNIQSNFLHDLKKIEVIYKGQTKQYDLGDDYLDLATFMFQFNFEENNKKKYQFNVVEGKKMRIYEYEFIKDQVLTIDEQLIDSKIFEGKVNKDDRTKHYVWISKNPYRIPLKIKVTTDLGLLLDLKIKKTNLF